MFRKSVEKFQVSLKSGKNDGCFTWRPIRVYDTSLTSYNKKYFRQKLRENRNTHFMFDNFFFPGNRAVYDILWKNIEAWGGPQLTIWRMRIACGITKATNARSEYVIFITFPLQQWLFERASLLRSYARCLSCLNPKLRFLFYTDENVKKFSVYTKCIYCTSRKGCIEKKLPNPKVLLHAAVCLHTDRPRRFEGYYWLKLLREEEALF